MTYVQALVKEMALEFNATALKEIADNAEMFGAQLLKMAQNRGKEDFHEGIEIAQMTDPFRMLAYHCRKIIELQNL